MTATGHKLIVCNRVGVPLGSFNNKSVHGQPPEISDPEYNLLDKMSREKKYVWAENE